MSKARRRHSFAILLKLAPGSHSGTYFRAGITSTRNVPGMRAGTQGSTPAFAKAMYLSVFEVISSPYAVERMASPERLNVI